MLLSGKVISVTGGSSGIGEEIVKKLINENAQVALIDVDRENGLRIQKQHDNVTYFYGDVTSSDGIKETFHGIESHYGQLDGAVNNAGIGGDRAKVADYTVASWRRVMSINLDGVFYCVQAEVPLLLNTGNGSIVNVASILGVVGQGDICGYVASKHGVIGLTKSIAADYGRDGIRCNAVCPSYIKTPLTEPTIDADTWTQLENKHSIGRCVTKADVAAMVAFLLSDETRTITGGVHMVDGGYTSV